MATKKDSPSGRRDSFTDLTKKLKCEVQGLEGGINNLFRKGVSVLNKKLYSSVPTSKNLQGKSVNWGEKISRQIRNYRNS